MRHSIMGKENAWEARGGVERVALIKSLIYARWKRVALEVQLPNWAENVSWYYILLLMLCTGWKLSSINADVVNSSFEKALCLIF